jgi:hypothetical protein
MGIRRQVAGGVSVVAVLILVTEAYYEIQSRGQDPGAVGRAARFLLDLPSWFTLFALLFGLFAVWVYAYDGVVAVRAEYAEKGHTADQQFADWLTEQVEYATHDLLNRIVDVQGGDGGGLFDFIRDAAKWTGTVTERMRSHGCSPQEVQHVATLVKVPPGNFDPDPVMNEQKKMVAERISRIQGVAQKYAAQAVSVS